MLDFDQFYKEKFLSVSKYGMSNGLSEADSKDLAQNVLVDFWQRLESGKIDQSKNADSFLFQRAKWRLIDRIRSNSDLAAKQELAGEENDLDILPAEKKEERPKHLRLLTAAIREINKRKTTSFKLFYEAVFNDKSVADICKQYGIKPITVHIEKCRQGKKLVAAAQQLLKDGF